MKKIFIDSMPFFLFIAVPFAQAMDHDRSDGRGGYYTNDEKKHPQRWQRWILSSGW